MVWNQAHAPLLLVKSFPKTPRTQSEASRFGGTHNYKTKQNKLPSFIEIDGSWLFHTNTLSSAFRLFFEDYFGYGFHSSKATLN